MNNTVDYKEVLNRRMVRWSIVLTVLIALFWGVFWLIKGYVPESTDSLYLLPESVSSVQRGWDIVFGFPIGVTLAYLSVPDKPKISKPMYRIGLVLGLAIGALSIYLHRLGANDKIALAIVSLACCAYSMNTRHNIRVISGSDTKSRIGVRAGFFVAFGIWIAQSIAIGYSSFIFVLEFLVFYGVYILLFVDGPPYIWSAVKKAGQWLESSNI